MVDSDELAHRRHTIIHQHERLVEELKRRKAEGVLGRFLAKPADDEAVVWRRLFGETMRATRNYCVGSDNPRLLEELPLVRYHEGTDFSLGPELLLDDLESQLDVLKVHHSKATPTAYPAAGVIRPEDEKMDDPARPPVRHAGRLPIPPDLPERLNEAMEKHGHTQQQAADAAGHMDMKTFKKLLRGVGAVQQATLKAAEEYIAKAPAKRQVRDS